MKSKKTIILTLILAFAAGASGAAMHYRTTQYPAVRAHGIDELGLKLELPGGAENPGDFVIRNLGEHTVIGYRVVYEAHAKSGEVHEWSQMMIQPLAFPSFKERKAEYLTPRYSCIPPGMIGFGGLLREVQAQDGRALPELEIKRAWVPGPGFQYYDRIEARLDSVMLEDGQIHGVNKGALIGQTRQSFEEQMDEFLGSLLDGESEGAADADK